MNEELKAQLKPFKTTRKGVKTQLTLFKKYLEKLPNETLAINDIYELTERLNSVEPLLNQFNNVQDTIDSLLEEHELQLNNELEQRESFQDTYFSLITKAKQMLQQNTNEPQIHANNSIARSSTPSSEVRARCSLKLPPISLPTFDGTFTTWRSFHDSFTSLIHNNTDITDVQKLTYLKSSLKGEPLELTATLETTDINYKIAWDSLVKRYNNTRRIVNTHIQTLLNLPSVTRESSLPLREFINNIQNHISCLNSLKQPVETWDAIIVPILLGKLDNQTVKEWETYLNNKQDADTNSIPTFKEFLKFLNNKQSTLEFINQKRVQDTAKPQSIQHTRVQRTFMTTEAKCLLCNQSHLLYQCQSFLDLDIPKRNAKIRELKICLNCFKKGHFLSECKSPKTCRKCHKRHHTLLHLEKQVQNADAKPEQQIVSSKNSAETTSCSASQISNQTILSTAIVKITDLSNKVHYARALLDSASQSNFITKALADKLNLKTNQTDVNVIGIGQGSISIKQRVQVTFQSCHNNYKNSLNCLIVEQITSNLPLTNLNPGLINVPANIRLADPEYFESRPIDLLIGAGLFWSLLSIGQIHDKLLTYQKTKLGWVIAGELITNENIIEFNKINISCCALDVLTKNVERFWNSDEFEQRGDKFLTPADLFCEDFFVKTTTRDSKNKFIVKIPFKETLNELGSSKNVAESRFKMLENRFAKNSQLKSEYTNFMNEYINLKHMTPIDSTLDKLHETGYFLPHHAVIKNSSVTTKLRVVFDGSCKTTNNVSINDVQYAGPTIQDDIFTIITRFRMHKFVLTGDIEKMYRQVWIHPDHRQYQKIVWRNNPDEELKTYELNTVTYGTSSAPFLAVRCLKQLAIENQSSYPLEAKILDQDFYVDDMITGSDTKANLESIKFNIQKILQTSGFTLRKFNSNVPELCDHFLDQADLNLTNNTESKTLGILWNSRADILQYSNPETKGRTDVTKRSVLAETAQLFDPLGLLSPIIILPKLIIQNLWQLNLSWDESIPMELHVRWKKFKDSLHHINKITIPRNLLINNHTKIEIHAFADASQQAYGSCIYVRSLNNDNKVSTHLLATKSRVAPVKVITLPRLELCAAVLSVQLVEKIKRILNNSVRIERVYYWSDSTITLSWIKICPSKLKTYVAHRVSEIQRLSNTNDWFHVHTSENPADLITRGLYANQLITNNLWWYGPDWLSDCTIKTSKEKTNLNLHELPEVKQTAQTFITSIENDAFIKRYSSLAKLNRVIAYCIRFKNNSLKSKGDSRYDNFTVSELSHALKKIIILIQKSTYAREYNALKTKRQIDNKSRLKSLTPFLDEEDLIRVGGRLTLTDFNYDKRHPIILPKSHHFTQLIFQHEHLRLAHAGPKLLLASIRENYWPIAGMNIAKKTVRNCNHCFKFDPKCANQLMGNLPIERTQLMYPFHSTGVDYAGPYSVKSRSGRGAVVSKAYICIFICFATKAIHIELVSDLTTKLFLLAFKRFIARRGKPLHIFSDNATNFIGAKNELINLFEFLKQNDSNFQNHFLNEGINWHFIPPRSPTFGGLWEAGVKRVKFHLSRILTNLPVTFEELTTFLAHVESVLNSRPLCSLSPDPNDLEILTPAHFLIGRSFSALPDPNVHDIPNCRLNRYQMLQKLHQQFWKKWSRDYLSELQQRTKWQTATPPINNGSMVLLKDENLPPSQWRIGRVIQLHPGTDGHTRVVTVKCKNSEVKRAIGKVCVLPSQ